MSDAPIRGQTGIASLAPFGLGHQKPHHVLEMFEVLQENLDSLPYAWRILDQGVCDGCSLGPRGLRDDVVDGIHLCTTRLKLLRLNTMPALKPADLLDIDRLRRMDNRQLQALGRIPYPFLYRKGDRGFTRVSWDDALAIAGTALRDTPPPRQAWFATSRGITNETYYTFGKAARLCGVNNVDLCARLCHQASVSGLKATIGVGAATCSLSDLIGTDLLLLWGTDIANNQPVTMKYLAHAKARGTRVVVINPMREAGLERYWVPSMPVSALFGTKIQDDFVQVRVGGDIALIQGILKRLVETGRADRAWIDAHTTGWAALEAHVTALPWERIEADSGVPRAQIEWLAELYGRARTCVSVWSMGLTQHTFGTENVEAVACLHLARGMVGRPHTGLVPIRGHSGVQGGGECGVGPNLLPGGIPLDDASAAAFEAHWGHPIPRAPGLTTMRMVEAMGRGDVDLLYNLGGNLLAVLPDPAWVADAFARTRVRIHQDIVFNTSTVLDPGELVLVLPAQTRYEQLGGGTSTNTERRIRFSPEIPGHPTVGEARPEWQIPCQLAMAAFPALRDALDYPTSQPIRDEMARTIPLYAGIDTLRKAGDWVQWGGPLLCDDGTFPGMPDGRAAFRVAEAPRVEVPEGAFYLTTRRGKQFNSIVIKDHDPVQGGRARDDVLVSAEDLSRLGMADGSRAVLVNDVGRFPCTLRRADVRPGVLQAYWPECNVVIGRRLDPRSEEPDYNAPVWVERPGSE
jgi:molybdopterin-dependent oxidoreductase alpha subunit